MAVEERPILPGQGAASGGSMGVVVVVVVVVLALPSRTLGTLTLFGAQGFPILLLGPVGADREQREQALERGGPTLGAGGHGRASDQKLELTVAGGATILEQRHGMLLVRHGRRLAPRRRAVMGLVLGDSNRGCTPERSVLTGRDLREQYVQGLSRESAIVLRPNPGFLLVLVSAETSTNVGPARLRMARPATARC